MKCSFGISNFLEEISSLSHSIVFLYFFALLRAVYCHCGSAGKESAWNAGDLGLIPGLGDPLEKGKATHSSILA